MRVFIVIIYFFLLNTASACFDSMSKRKTLLYEIPKNLGKAEHVAMVTLKEIISGKYGVAVVVDRKLGFENVAEFILHIGESTCDTQFEFDDIGRNFFVAGRLERRPRGRPLFQGAWSYNGNLNSEHEFQAWLQLRKWDAPE